MGLGLTLRKKLKKTNEIVRIATTEVQKQLLPK